MLIMVFSNKTDNIDLRSRNNGYEYPGLGI